MYQPHYRCFLLICLFIVIGLNQVAAQGDDHGNSCETGTPVDLVALTTSTTQEILGALTPNDQDFFIIAVPSPNALVTVSTVGETNTFGRISHIVDGVPVFLDDDSSGGTFPNFLLSQPLDEGTYCVEVRGQNPGVQGPYVLQVEADIPGDVHGNSCDTATPVGQSEILGDLSVYGDGDFFLFQVPPGGGTLTVNTTGETDTFGRISRMVEGEPIFLDDDSSGGTFPNFLLSQPLDEGTYCVEVRGQNTGIRGPYVLQVAGDFIPAGSCSGTAVTVSVPTLAFGPVTVGTLSVPQNITISNSGSGRLIIDPGTLRGADAGQFGILNDTCAERVLQPGEQCSLRGIFAPLNAGLKTALIAIPCNDLDSLPLEVGLSGEGTIVQ